LPCAHLHHAVVLARGLHHLAAFVDGDADRLFDVYVLAVLARLNGHVGVPVIGSRDVHGVDGLVLENITKIGDALRSGARVGRAIAAAAADGHGFFQIRLVNVADDRHFHIGQLQGILHAFGAHAAHADERHADAVVGAAHVAGEDGGSQRRTRGFQKISAIVHVYPFTTILTSLSGTTITFTTCLPLMNGCTLGSASARSRRTSFGVPNGTDRCARSLPFTCTTISASASLASAAS